MPTRLSPGDHCDGHELLRFLGSGKASDVWAARQPTGGVCALKLMRAPGTDGEKARFAREGEAIARIVHPSVVRVFGAGAWEDRVWLALELIEGETLRQKINPGPGAPPLPVDDLLDWIQQVCEGLEQAHASGVVHRGLDLDSIVITAGGRARIIGFGMASLPSWGVLTTEKQQIGSAKNLAPEAIKRTGASPRSDIYALGHVLYEALTGSHAMGAQERLMMDVIRWHIHEHARPLQEIAPGAPPALAALVHEMLEKDPAKRPPSMLAVGERVRRVRADLRASVLHAVRSVPRPEAVPAMAGTIPMAACDVPASVPVASAPPRSSLPWMSSMPVTSVPVSSIARGTLVLAEVPTPPAPERVAMLPAPAPVPTLISALAPQVAAPVSRLPQPSLVPAAPPELRVTDAPVESAARRSSVTPRRTSVAAFLALAGAMTLASGWIVVTRTVATSARPAAPPPPPPAPVSPAPSVTATATATASAATSLTRTHRPPTTSSPIRPPRTKGTP